MVESLDLYVDEDIDENSTARLPLTVIKEIFRRNCTQLELNGPATRITLSEAEQLLQVSECKNHKMKHTFQYFHHLEKKVRFETWTHSQSTGAVCANCRVYTVSYFNYEAIRFE